MNVLELLRPVREKRVESLEEIADRLVAGEKISPEVIDGVLTAAHKDPADLQAIIDRKVRLRELVEIVKGSSGAAKRLQVVESEIASAAKALDVAVEKLKAVRTKYDGERAALKTTVATAEAARVEIFSKDVLPVALWAELSEAETAADDAREEFERASRHLSTVKSRFNDAEARKRHVDGGGSAKYEGRWMTREEASQLASDAAVALKAQEAAIPKLEKAWEAACEARDATRAKILREVGL